MGQIAAGKWVSYKYTPTTASMNYQLTSASSYVFPNMLLFSAKSRLHHGLVFTDLFSDFFKFVKSLFMCTMPDEKDDPNEKDVFDVSEFGKDACSVISLSSNVQN